MDTIIIVVITVLISLFGAFIFYSFKDLKGDIKELKGDIKAI